MLKWHKIKEEIRDYKHKNYHWGAEQMAECFKNRFEKTTATVPLQIGKEKRERYIKYRNILKSITKAIHYLARQNMPLRGPREKIVFNNCESNPGNFIALLKLLSENESILREHLTVPIMRNATTLGISLKMN